MNKFEFNVYKRKHEIVKYGARYGYWWKKHKEIYRRLKHFSFYIDYTHDLEFRLDKPISGKHIKRWLRCDIDKDIVFI